MVRVGPEAYTSAFELSEAREMDFTGLWSRSSSERAPAASRAPARETIWLVLPLTPRALRPPATGFSPTSQVEEATMSAQSRTGPPGGRGRSSGRAKTEEAEPRFRAYLAVSLDGYIADAAGEVGWLDPYFSPEVDFGAFFRSIGAMVMGRTTWDWAVAHGHSFEPRGRCIVQTHRPLGSASPGVETFAGDVRNLAADLRRVLGGTGKDVWLMGGGESLAGFDEHGLVDRWELKIIPVLVGAGAPLFPRRSRPVTPLRLVHSRALANGVVQVEYEPERRGR